MSALTPFDFHGHAVRTIVGADGEPRFVLADICGVLGINNARMVAQRLPEDAVSQADVIDSMGRPQRTNVITEAGLYRVVMRSDSPKAETFIAWVTSDVLPTIRRTGSYAAPALTPDEIVHQALQITANRVKELEAKVAQDAPKVLFADAVATSDTDILVGELAKILRGNGLDDFGQNRLFERLRDEGYLIKRKGSDWNMPTQRAMELGLFRIKETAIAKPDGTVSVSKTPKVTGKGQAYFIKRYLGTEPLNLQVAA